MTLLESCITVTIISVTAVVAIPSLIRAREDYELNAAARQVAGHMHSARIKAVNRNRDCRVRVTSPVTSVIECEDPFWKPEETLVLPRGFRVAANATPQFHRRGNVSPTATVSVFNRQGRSRRVIVNITGRVRVE